MSNKRYPEEFKIEAVKQINERGHGVAVVSARIGVSPHSLYQWIKLDGVPVAERLESQSQSAVIRQLKSELKRVPRSVTSKKRQPRTLPRTSGKVRLHPYA